MGVKGEIWRSQIVTSNPSAKMGLRRRPYAFTEQGVAMLSSVLDSKRAVQVNIGPTQGKNLSTPSPRQAITLKVEGLQKAVLFLVE